MGKLILYGALLWLAAAPAMAESGPQRQSIRERLRESGLDKNLRVLDDYYQAVSAKVQSVEPRYSEPSLKNIVEQETPEKTGAVMPPQENLPVSAPLPSVLKFRGRDPFSITEEMVQGNASLQASLDFIPDDKPKFSIPEMHLRGLVRRKDGAYAAVLDIEGYGTKVVRKGDTIGLLGSGDDAAVRIKEIDRLQIIVEAGKVGKVIVVR